MSDNKDKSIKGWFAGLDPMWKLIIIALLILAVWAGIHFGSKWLKELRDQKIKENSTKTGNSDVTGTPVQVDLGTKAVGIYDAFHGSWFYEDEEAALTELASVPKSLVPDLSAIYYQLYKDNLKEDFRKYCSTEQWNSVQTKFN